MDRINGYHHALARVDLTRGTVSVEDIPGEILRAYAGGRGLGVFHVASGVPPTTDPLSPANTFVIATGPMTGTTVPTSGRFAAAFKSPLTGTIFDCNAGGSFGPAFKRCGFDALVIEGKATSPVYLHVTPGTVEILDAAATWGKPIGATTDAFHALHGKDAKVCCIGPAGENLVRFANVMNDRHHALGRGGSGAVLGSKLVKAIVAAPGKAGKIPPVARPDVLAMVIAEIHKRINASPVTGKGMRIFGTAQLVNLVNAMGLFPVRNFQRGTDPRSANLSGEAILESIYKSRSSCFMCPIGCGRMTATTTRSGKGPEYESDWALGASCEIFDLETVTNANYECNELGMDTISAGATIACAMELNDAGKLDATWKDVRFGNKDALVGLVRATGLKEGIGASLAEGSARLAMAHRMPGAAMQVKGLEMPAYDPRGAFGMALAYATSNRGACHLRAYTIGAELLGLPKLFDRFSFSDKPDLVVKLQDSNGFYDSIVACKFTGMGVPDDYYTRAISAITGIDISTTEAERIGERLYNLERLYNTRAGFTRKDDALPARFSEPLEAGASRGKVPPIEVMLNMYYDIRGWDHEGVPLQATIERLGIGNVITR